MNKEEVKVFNKDEKLQKITRDEGCTATMKNPLNRIKKILNDIKKLRSELKDRGVENHCS